MSVEASYNPQPLALPPCWVTDKQLSIVIDYDGPSLTGSTITLSFTGGLTQQVATFVEDFSAEFPDRHVITFAPFAPGVPTTDDNIVKYKLNILYADGNNVPLYYGAWQLTELEL